MPLNRDKLTLEEIDALENRGWSLDDPNLDADTAFDEYCEWHGFMHWGSQFRYTLARLKAAEEAQ